MEAGHLSKRKKRNCLCKGPEAKDGSAHSGLVGIGLSGWIIGEWRKMRLGRKKPDPEVFGGHAKEVSSRMSHSDYLSTCMERAIPQKESFQKTETIFHLPHNFLVSFF